MDKALSGYTKLLRIGKCIIKTELSQVIELEVKQYFGKL